jgi:signal transduction histidine kinase
MLYRPEKAILIACLMLALYIGFLMTWIYNSRIDIGDSILKRYLADIEKQVTSIGYFFSERKYDIRSIAASREITTYFLNKSLGMSEQYGLRVNLFLIGQTLNNTLKDKTIHGNGIYKRFLLLDCYRKPLVDTFPSAILEPPGLQNASPSKDKSPEVFLEQTNGRTNIVIYMPCFLKEQFVGELYAWIDIQTVTNHLVNNQPNTGQNNYLLATQSGKPFCLAEITGCLGFESMSPERILQLPVGDFERMNNVVSVSPGQSIMLTRYPVPDVPLQLLASIPLTEIYGTLSPWQILLGMGSLALAIILGLGVLLQFNTRHLVLATRFDESKRQQNLLTQKNQQLQAEILRRQEVEQELESQRTKRMRSDRLRSLGEMAAGIAHELNQPLVGVRGLAEIVLLNIGNGQKPLTDMIQKNVSRIVEQADRMVHIINHVRLFAREAGKVETSRVDLNEVVRSGIDILDAQFKAHGLMLETVFSTCLLPVLVNPYSVEEVILNMLSNSRDALDKKLQQSPEGFLPTIQISTQLVRTDAAPVVRLIIKDNGIGIPFDNAEKIFDPFFTTKDPDKGTGLGLSISKTIIEDFDGQIHFISTEGESTVFMIDLPACSHEEPIDEPKPIFKNTDR